MRRNKKILGLLACASFVLAGCSCSNDTGKESITANVSNGENQIVSGLTEGTKSLNLQELYENLKSSSGNEVVADKLIQIISDSILSDATWKARYDAKMAEKMDELIESGNYEVDGEFDEELLVKSLKASLYNVTCENNEYGPTYKTDGVTVDEYLLCDYSDYKEKALKVDVINEILNEKYIYDKVLKDKTNLLTTKKARVVEYVSISSSDEDAWDFITEKVNELAASDSTLTLEEIKDSWVEKLITDIGEEYAKIGTSEDSNGSILSDYTGGYKYSKEEGLHLKKQEVYEESYYDDVVITSDSNSILNSTLVERILSDNVLDANVSKTIKINNSYYLVSPLAGSNVDASDIRITDTSNSKYYLVKVDVINSESNEDLIYRAVKVLATNESLVSDSVNYYLEQNKNNISVHDEEVYAYLKTQYPDIFVD